jgi:hypothetical protein
MATLLAANGHAATLYIVTREKRRNNRLCGSGAWGNLCPPRSHGRDGDDELGKHKEKNDTACVAHRRHSPNATRRRGGAGGCSLANWETSVAAERFTFQTAREDLHWLCSRRRSRLIAPTARTP